MGELSVATPRELAGHYRETRKRLMSPVAFVPQPIEPTPQHKANMRELARLRLETKIFREFLAEHGIDPNSVINRKPKIPTGGIDRLTMKQILAAVCTRFLVTPVDLMAARRTRAFVTPRHVAFYLAKQLTEKSFPEIGRHVGNRDHTTVLHGVRRIAKMILTDANLAHDVALLHIELGREGRQ